MRFCFVRQSVRSIAYPQFPGNSKPINQMLYLYVRKVVFVKYGYFFAADPNPENNGAQIQRKFKARCFGTNALITTGVNNGCRKGTAWNWRDTSPSIFEMGRGKGAIVVTVR